MPLTNTARGCRLRSDRLAYNMRPPLGRYACDHATLNSRSGRGHQPSGASSPLGLSRDYDSTAWDTRSGCARPSIFACLWTMRPIGLRLLLPHPPTPSHREGERPRTYAPQADAGGYSWRPPSSSLQGKRRAPSIFVCRGTLRLAPTYLFYALRARKKNFGCLIPFFYSVSCGYYAALRRQGGLKDLLLLFNFGFLAFRG